MKQYSQIEIDILWADNKDQYNKLLDILAVRKNNIKISTYRLHEWCKWLDNDLDCGIKCYICNEIIKYDVGTHPYLIRQHALYHLDEHNLLVLL